MARIVNSLPMERSFSVNVGYVRINQMLSLGRAHWLGCSVLITFRFFMGFWNVSAVGFIVTVVIVSVKTLLKSFLLFVIYQKIWLLCLISCEICIPYAAMCDLIVCCYCNFSKNFLRCVFLCMETVIRQCFDCLTGWFLRQFANFYPVSIANFACTSNWHAWHGTIWLCSTELIGWPWTVATFDIMRCWVLDSSEMAKQSRIQTQHCLEAALFSIGLRWSYWRGPW